MAFLILNCGIFNQQLDNSLAFMKVFKSVPVVFLQFIDGSLSILS